jgi:OOP family OmpA-OmpF porin
VVEPVAAPAPVLIERSAVQAPMPEAVVQAAPPPAPVEAPARRSVSYAAESMFDFDGSAVRPEGMQLLDKFVRELEGASYEKITVEGHTDRLGAPAYNQALSERRAGSVKDFLVGAGKLDAAKIAAGGKGESQPVTKPEDCVGEKQTAKLIACLQPDRRVEIDVVGTR